VLPPIFHCLAAVSIGFPSTVAKCCAAPPVGKLSWEDPLPAVLLPLACQGPWAPTKHLPATLLLHSFRTALLFSGVLSILTKLRTDSNHPASKLQQLEGPLGKDMTSGREQTRDKVKNYLCTNAAKPVRSYNVFHSSLTKRRPTCYPDAAARP